MPSIPGRIAYSNRDKHIEVWGSPSMGGNGWVDQAYRTITLAEPATGELLTWLQKNATKK